MSFNYARCSPEREVRFARPWNFTIYCLPETKTDLSEIILQLRANTPWCNSLGQSPARCKKIFLLFHFEFWTYVYLGLHLNIYISLGRSHTVRFTVQKLLRTVCINGNNFLDGKQQHLKVDCMAAEIFWTEATAVPITTRHCRRKKKSINTHRKACALWGS